MGLDYSGTGRILGRRTYVPPARTAKPWMYLPEQEPGQPVTSVEIYTLAAAITNLDTGPVLALGARAARAGQKQLAIELYRCIVAENRVRQVAIGQLRYVAEKLNEGSYAA